MNSRTPPDPGEPRPFPTPPAPVTMEPGDPRARGPAPAVANDHSRHPRRVAMSPSNSNPSPKSRKSDAPSPSPSKSRHASKTRTLRVPLLPLRGDVVFPQTVVPLIINRASGIKLVDDVYPKEVPVGLVTQRDPERETPGFEDLHPHVCLGSILKMLKFPDGSTRVVCQGESRAKLLRIERSEPYLVGVVQPLEDKVRPGVELNAATLIVNKLFQKIVDQSQQVPEELQVAAMNTGEPGRLADLLGSNLPFTVEERQLLLGETDVNARLHRLAGFLRKQIEILEISSRIQSKVGSEITRAQREHFLRQQIRAIREELGESEKDNPEFEQLWKRVEEADPPREVLQEAERELERLASMHPGSAEHSIIRTYLDWIAALPWSKSAPERINLAAARKILDADHYDLEKVKRRILEYLAVRKLKKDMKGPILCFAGPPGTGKTSLGKSVARSLGREFVRVSLGGVHDEAEIRGHRRTYVAAMPGRILQGLRKAGVNNPVFMLDEIDKLGHDFRGDPAAALLEVLDPEQNKAFHDHYLDVDFDLSRVMFIATANVLDAIPHALRDRMEILELPGYAEEEKLLIAQRHLIPKQLAEHGLKPDDVRFEEDALRRIVADYTREAGLRNLEREIAAVCRKIAYKHAAGQRRFTSVTAARVHEWLGPPRFHREIADRAPAPGVSVGLAWTPAGGEILFIEATRMPGKGALTLTGLLGESMKESAQAALSYLKAHAAELDIPPDLLPNSDVHVHVPAGAVPKDGPSAGVAIAAALLGLFRDTPVSPALAMTGELTLTGRILPVGGVREKILAARRAGVRTVLLPAHNAKDLEDLPADVRRDLRFHFVEHLADVVPHLFPRKTESDSKPKPKPKPEPKAAAPARSAVANRPRPS